MVLQDKKTPLIFFDFKPFMGFWQNQSNYLGDVDKRTEYNKNNTFIPYNYSLQDSYPVIFIKNFIKEHPNDYLLVPLFSPIQGANEIYLKSTNSEDKTFKNTDFLNYLQIDEQCFEDDFGKNYLIYSPSDYDKFFEAFKKYWEELALISINKANDLINQIGQKYDQDLQKATADQKKSIMFAYGQITAPLYKLNQDPYEILIHNGLVYSQNELENFFKLKNRQKMLEVDLKTKNTIVYNEDFFTNEFRKFIDKEKEFLGKYWNKPEEFKKYQQESFLKAINDKYKLCGKGKDNSR